MLFQAKQKLPQILLAATACLALAGCGPDMQDQLNPRLAIMPAHLRQMEAGPLTSRTLLINQEAKEAPTGDPAAGKTVYTASCLMCHQAARQGMPPMVPSLVGVTTRMSNDAIRQIILKGKSGGQMAMPAFADKLSKPDIDNLIAYLATNP